MTTQEQFLCPVTRHRDDTYTISISIDFGNMEPEDFSKIAELAKKYQVTRLAPTTAKRISFYNTPAEAVNPLWQELQQVFGDRLIAMKGKVVACPGTPDCRFAMKGLRSHEVAVEVAKISCQHRRTNLKVGISNCPRSCAMSQVRDIGIIATANGWSLTVGGNGGVKPGLSYTLATGLTTEQLLPMVDRLYTILEEQAVNDERAIRTIERLGVEAVKEQLQQI